MIWRQVRRKRGSRGVVGEPVDFDDQPLFAPEQVELVALDVHVGLRSRQPRGCDEGEQPPLGL
jgi:hypothetical protein